MSWRAGTTLLVLTLLAALGTLWGQALLRQAAGPPVPLPAGPANYVLLGPGFPEPGIHQFSDGQALFGVINMTHLPGAAAPSLDPCLHSLLEPGTAFDLVVESHQLVDIIEYPMPSGQRLALGIRLHPDRMTLDDWEILPGVGPAMARRIELDRQENGDFGSLERLQRVRGVGPKRIQAWQDFF